MRKPLSLLINVYEAQSAQAENRASYEVISVLP
jgi:hypothetical protein